MGVELNKINDIIGAVAQDVIPEGRMVIMTTNSLTHNFGGWGDLPGARLPAIEAEAVEAKYVAVFAQDSRPTPLFQNLPNYSFQLRGGWGSGSDNASPLASQTVYLAHPNSMVGQSIPSGDRLALHAGGTYTVPSGAYVHSASLEVPGATLEALNTADDGAGSAGKLRQDNDGTIAVVERYNSANGELTFRTHKP